MDLDALLARSQAPGQFVERQSFTLSRSKALEKMRAFTLRTPAQFGLELVQAGVFAGANWVFADADAHQATIGWVGGRTLRKEELNQLLDYLFVAEGASDDRHLRQLAVAVNVLIRRKPMLLRVESGDADGAVRLDLEADGTGVVGEPAERIFGTYLHVRFSTPWFWDTKSQSQAAQLIETECTYSPVPIFVNGTGPHGWDRNLPLSNLMSGSELTFRRNGRDGWLGVPPRVDKHYPPRVKVVVGGVVVSRREVPEFGPNVEGVIRDDQLAKTADMSDVVADDNWNRVLHDLQGDVVDRFQSRRNPLWEPPELEPLQVPGTDDAEDEPTMAVRSLEAGLTLLGLDTPLALRDLEHFKEPMYWVSASDAPDLIDHLSVVTFPARVAVVDDEQREAFAEAVEHLRPLRPFRVQPDDAAFVIEQVRKGIELHETTVSTSIGLLHLRHHLRGAMPGWRIKPAGLPVLLRRANGRYESHTLLLHLPRVSAVLELDADVDDDASILHELAHVIERHIWELAEVVASPALTRELLSQAVFLQPNGTSGHAVRLPSSWPEDADALLDQPLAKDGPSAREALATLGTSNVLEVGQDAGLVRAFVDRFGPGHIHAAGQAPRPLIVVQWDGRVWAQAEHAHHAVARGVIMIMDRFVSVDNGISTPHPLFVAAKRSPDEPVPFDAGYHLLRDILSVAADEDLLDAERDLVRLARMVLIPNRTVLDASDGSQTSVQAIQDGTVRIALRGGPAVSEAETVVLTVDEVVAIGGAPRWRLDDPPDLWSPEPAEGAWLVTSDVLEPGLEGWIGLRFPYDPTGALLLQQGLATRVLTGVEHALRFHGWLRQTTTDDILPVLHEHTADVLLRLSQLNALDDAHEQAARRYCADFAAIARLHPECGIAPQLANRLAQRVPVSDWGNLAGWLVAPEDHRPELDFVVRGLTGEALRPDADLQSESSGSLLLDALRLALGRAGLSSRTSVFINPDGWHTAVWDSGSVCVSFGGRSTAVRQADKGERRPLALVLLDAVRRLYLYETQAGTSTLDLLQMQRAALDAVESVARR